MNPPSESQDLSAYLKDLPRGGLKPFADSVPISVIYLQQLAARTEGRQPAPKLAHKISAATGGKVPLWHLRWKDWWEQWPHLVGTPGAPAPGQHAEDSPATAATAAPAAPAAPAAAEAAEHPAAAGEREPKPGQNEIDRVVYGTVLPPSLRNVTEPRTKPSRER